MTDSDSRSPASSTTSAPAAPGGGTIGFDREQYIELQSRHIQHRRDQIGGKLYLEMGGKLFDDHHASRVLPGFTPDNKIAMLHRLRDELEILVCLNAKDLERQKVRADLGIPYEDDVLRLIDVFREHGFLVENVVLTQLEESTHVAPAFMERTQRLGMKVSLTQGRRENIKITTPLDLFLGEAILDARDGRVL